MTDAVAAPAAQSVKIGDLAPGTAPDQAYVDKMLAATHGDPVAPPPAPAAGQRPEHVQEQFWDTDKGAVKTDDLAKAYAELRAKMDAGTKTPEVDPNAPPADPNAKPALKIEKPEEKAAEPAPLSAAIASFEEAFNASGKVEDDQYAALEALGLPRAKVEIYMAGLAALESQALTEVQTVAGGAENFTAAQTWARDNLNDADLAYYNDNVDNPASRKQAVEWLMSKYGAARPSEGKLIGDALAPTANAGDVYSSDAQVTEAMRNPAYKTDPAFRKAVADKMLRSQRAGTINAAAEFYSRS